MINCDAQWVYALIDPTAYKQADSEYQQVMQSIAKSLGVQA